MAVPTHSNSKSTSVENTGVPVLFSIKNVQPLILAAKPAANIIDQHGSAPTLTTTVSSLESAAHTVSSQTTDAIDLQQKARRSGMLSKVIATGFVLMLVIVVVRFSVPGSRMSSDVANSGEPNLSDTPEHDSTSVVTGPESSSGNDGARVASLPVTPEFNLGTLESAPIAPNHNVPALPPLLPVSNTRDSSANSLVAPSPISLQPPVVTQGAPIGATPSGSGESSKFQTLEIPSSTPMTALPQQSVSKQTDVANLAPSQDPSYEANGTSDNLQILETLTPERSLAEFEWLFRNATKNPLIPYRPVSAGGHESGADQQMAERSPTIPSTGFGPPSGVDQRPPQAGPTSYQPLTIPSSDVVPPYEKNIPNQSLNRYQPIKQPQKIPLPETSRMGTSTTPAPYQPLVIPETPQPGTSGTSYGYPPVQYSPPPSGTNQNSSVQYVPGQR